MRKLAILITALSLLMLSGKPILMQAQTPEPTGWYAGDMHVHRSCGGSPETVPAMFSRMTSQNLSVASLLADSGNGEVQDPVTDLLLVNGQDDSNSTASRILHWDAEWHWDPTYTQYAHQALGGHIVSLSLSSAEQLWDEYTFPILDWAHQHNGIAGFAHMQYLDGTVLPSLLTCCSPIEYPVEVALGAADFISEDVDDVNSSFSSSSNPAMYSESPINAYYKLLNSGFRPGFAAGTDYPCNNSDDLGSLLTYVQVPSGELTYSNWIQGIANGRTVVSRNGHNEFLNLTVNGTSAPGDEITMPSAGDVAVTVQWTANQDLSGTIELVQNGVVIASKSASVSSSTPATLTATVNFAKSGWLAARRMGTNPLTSNYEHYVHTAAAFVTVNNAPIRTSQTDAQYFVDWTSGLLQNTSSGGKWNSYFPTSLTQAQARYQAANALFEQIAAEANGSGPTLSSIALTPINRAVAPGSQVPYIATGTYSDASTLNITAQVRWASSSPSVATISTRGLVSAISLGTTTISASLNDVTSSTSLTVTNTPLVISTQSLATGAVGVSYSAGVTATGGTPAYTWSIASGSLPPGLSLNSATGSITGTPTTSGNYGFTVQVTDSSSPLQTAMASLSISIPPLAISTQSLAIGTVGVSYSAEVAATGGTPAYTWSIASGSLPPGLSLNSATGSITGTPTTSGNYGFTVQVTDSSSLQQIATATFSIVIASSSGVSCPCTIWPSTAVPGTADSGANPPVEIGVKFRADTDGYITGIRFYKGTGNTGTHVGNLWNLSGAQLATATFSDETASGWQQVNFSSAVAVTANTVYVASYHTTTGHYAADYQSFAAAGVDNSPLHALAEGVSGSNGVYTYGTASTFPTSGYESSNYWVDVVFVPAYSTTPPTVSSVTPANDSTGASLAPSVTATFSEPMTASTITTTTFVLADSGGNPVSANVTYDANTSTATLTPTFELAPLTTHTVTILGGSSGVTDFNGNALVSNYTWSFTTGAAPVDSGPGGPILVISSAVNPFSRYYGEILNAEGLNEYTITDISNVTSATLANYDVAILGDFSLSSSQVTMLASWVNAGGNLIAMHPDLQLAGLLGLTGTSQTLSNAYLAVNTTTPSGAGIVADTMQFHGSADLYTLNGATSLATLYSMASTGTTYPAATLASYGSGQASAFTYDLARSIVYTRQGNPAWSGQARDGQSGPVRSDDLFFGNASSDLQSDWVDLSKVAIPQADEQQRLLANLILQMNAARKPLPRFWYFPSGFKAVVVMTGDDHGSFYSGSTTEQRFQDDLTASATGCSVADWQCVRATAYLFPQALASNSLTDSQVAAYTAQGFEVSAHVDTNPTCSNWTTSSLDAQYTSLLASFTAQFPSLPAPQTHRMHCISWSDYDSQPKVELNHGIRLDTTYYYWPDTWVNNTPGMFTGSGMPMRYTDRNGNLINVYQATTQMTDESGQVYPFTTDTLLDNALGTTAYYGAFVVNAHNDNNSNSYPGIATDVIASAQSRGVPIVSALQLLTWLDGRNTSSFGSLSWNSNTLSFNITQATAARNLQAMLPANAPSGTLASITLNGAAVPYSTQTIKGISYAIFGAQSGSYIATYGGVQTSLSLSPSTITYGQSTTVSVTVSSPDSGTPTGTVSVTDGLGGTGDSCTITLASGSGSCTLTPSSASSGLTVTGNYSGDANFPANSGAATLTVNPAAATVTVTPYSLPYDGNAHTATGTATGVKGEALSGLDLTGTTHTDAGTYATDTWSFTDSTGNYSNVGSTTITDTIAKAAVTITASSFSKTYGTLYTPVGTEFTVSGLQGSDHVSGATLTSAGFAAAATLTSPGPYYAIVPSAAVFSAGNASNYTISYANGALTVNPAALNITANSISKTYGQTVSFAGTEFTTSGLVSGDAVTSVTLASAGAVSTATVSGSPYAITPSAAVGTGLGNYAISYVNGALTVNPAAATVTVTPYSLPYDGNAHTATGTATGVKGEALSGLDLTGTTHTDAGTYATDTWSFTDSTGNYSNVGSTTITDTIAKAAATVTLSNMEQLYTGAPLPVTVVTSPANLGVAVVYSSSSYVLSAVAPTNPGSYAVTVNVTDPNYVGTDMGTLQIDQLSPTLNLALQNGAPQTTPYGTTVYFELSMASGVVCPTGTVNFYVDGGSVPASAVALQGTGCVQPTELVEFQTASLTAGMHTITAVYSGDTYYSGATSNALPYTVTSEGTAVTLSTSATTINVGDEVTFTATVTTAGQGSFAQPPVGSVAFNEVDGQGNVIGTLGSIALASGSAALSTSSLTAGTYNVQAVFTDTDGNYQGSSSVVPVAVTVNLRVPIIHWTPNVGTITYGTSLGSDQLNATAADPETQLAVAGSFSYAPAAGTVPGTPNVNVQATFTPSDGTTYQTNSATTTITVQPAVLTVTADNQTMTYGGTPPTFSYQISGFINNEDASVLTTAPTCTTTATSSSAIGAYDITCSSGAAANYSFSYVKGTLEINAGTSTVTMTCPASVTYNGMAQTPCTAQVTGAGGLTETLVVSYTNNINVGTATATASFSGDANHSSSSNSANFAITQATQTITFTQPGSPVSYGVAPISLTATGGGSGNSVIFSIDPSSTATGTISGNTLTVTGVGSLVIDANQTGNSNYQMAAQVQQTIVINAATLTVTANNASRVYGNANPTFTGSISGALNGDSFTESYSTTAIISSNAGTYAIIPSAAGANLADYSISAQNGTFTITQAETTTSLATSNSSVNPGESVTLTAQVASATTGTPTGSVNFYNGSSLLGTTSLSAGTATLSSSSLTAGATNTLTAVYGGDLNFTTSSTTSSTSVVVAALDFTMTFSGSKTATVTAGNTATYQMVLNPLYGSYPGAVTFSATGLPPGGSITFSPSTISADGGQQTVTMTIKTTAVTAQLVPSRLVYGMAPIALALLLWPLAGARRMRQHGRKLRKFLCVVILLSSIAAIGSALSGCGGSIKGASNPQSYTVTIIAVSGNLQHTGTVTLNVQ
jgi:hypothetical protein